MSSSTVPDGKADIAGIYDRSRHNNAIDGITGLLFSNGRRFLQVIEGSSDSIETTFARIRRDSRHHDITVLRDAEVREREFGYWAMANRHRGERNEEFDTRLRMLVRNASPEIRDTFLHLLDSRAAFDRQPFWNAAEMSSFTASDTTGMP